VGQHLAAGLDYGDEQCGGEGVVKDDLVEFLGVVAIEDATLSRDIACEHHHDDRDYRV